MDALNNFKYPLFLLPCLLNLGKYYLNPMNLPANGYSMSVVIFGLDPASRQASTATGENGHYTPLNSALGAWLLLIHVVHEYHMLPDHRG